MRIVMIGAGGMAASHRKAYKMVSDFSVEAVCDICEGAAKQAAEELKCNYYTDIDKMLEECRPDAVDICIPSFLHYETIMKCLHKNLHVFCEKPMAHSLEEAKEILREMKKRKRIVKIGHVVRFWPEYQYLRQVIEKEPYGKLQHLLLQRQYGTHELGSWYMDPDKCKMAAFEMHIHDTDFVNYLFGIPQYVDSIGIERPEIHLSYLSTRYIFENKDIIVQAEAGWNDSSLEFSSGYRAVFEHGALEYKEGVVKEYSANEKGREVVIRNEHDVPSDIEGVIKEFQEFLGQAEGKEVKPLAPAESSAETILILEKEQESMKKREKVYCG